MSFLSPPVIGISIQPQRKLDAGNNSILMQVVPNESSSDVIEITQQPVQKGAMISDHIFKKPTTYSCTAYFQNNGVTSLFAGQAQGLSKIYDSLLKLQISAMPFDVITPKRVYKNMLLQSINQSTDKNTENTLYVSMTFQEVIIVNLLTTSIPPASQKSPQKTQATQPAGSKSILNRIFGGG